MTPICLVIKVWGTSTGRVEDEAFENTVLSRILSYYYEYYYIIMNWEHVLNFYFEQPMIEKIELESRILQNRVGKELWNITKQARIVQDENLVFYPSLALIFIANIFF